MLTNNLTLVSVIAGILFILAMIAIAASFKKPVYRRKGQLLLLNEQKFLAALMLALPPDTIATFKIRLLDIVTVHDGRNGRSLDGDLADYSVDFVLVDRNTSDVKLCIEMDMDSKTSSERLARNTFISRALRRAGIPHLRLPLVRYYDPARLRQVLVEAMNTPVVQEKPKEKVAYAYPKTAITAKA